VAGKVLSVGSDGETQAGDALAFPSEYNNGNQAGASGLDWNNGQKQRATLTGNVTYTFTALDVTGGAASLTLRLIQDGTGGRTVTWPAGVLWPGGTAPTLSTAASAIDIITFYWDGTNYYGAALLDFS
jgi:hypothetical protein